MSNRTLHRARRILVALSQQHEEGFLTGQRASGTATVRSLVGTPTISAGATAAVIVDGNIDYKRLFYVTEDTVLSEAGVTVPIRSVVGGIRHNTIPVGAGLRWFPPELGVEPVSVVATSPAGATDGLVKQAVIYEQLDREASRDLFLASVGMFPSLVLAWEDSKNFDRAGAAQVVRADRWTLYAVCSRKDAQERRGAEGLEIIDTIEELLMDRTSIEGALRLSSPGAEVYGRGRRTVSPQSLVYTVQLSTYRTVKRDDTAMKAKAVPWHTSKLDAIAAAQPPDLPDPKPIVVDNKVDMTE